MQARIFYMNHFMGNSPWSHGVVIFEFGYDEEAFFSENRSLLWELAFWARIRKIWPIYSIIDGSRRIQKWYLRSGTWTTTQAYMAQRTGWSLFCQGRSYLHWLDRVGVVIDPRMGRVPKYLFLLLRGIFSGDGRPETLWERPRNCEKRDFVTSNSDNSENKFVSIYSVKKGPSQPNGTTLRLGYEHPPALGSLHGPPFTNHPMQCMTRPSMYLRSRSRARFIIHSISFHLPRFVSVIKGLGVSWLLTVLKFLMFYAAILTFLLFATFLQTLLVLHFVTTSTIIFLRIVLLRVGEARVADLMPNRIVHEWSSFIWLMGIVGIFFTFFRFWRFGISHAHPPSSLHSPQEKW